MSKKKIQRRDASGLKEHRQEGKQLKPPLAQLPTTPTQMNWHRDVIPELFFIDAIVQQMSWKYAPRTFERFIDILDQFVPKGSKEIITGTISSFSLIPQEHQADARKALGEASFFDMPHSNGFLHGLALYPEGPATWIVEDWQHKSSIDWEKGTEYLKEAIQRLWDGHSVHATRCRMPALARLLKHGKILLPSNAKDFELFPKYPEKLNEEEQKIVEAISRTMFSVVIHGIPRVSHWPAYFWRQSYTLSPCIESLPRTNGNLLEGNQLHNILSKIAVETQNLRNRIIKNLQQVPLDVYDTDRDEVLHGLLSRQLRLFSVLARDPWMWTVDMGSMIHRAMADVLILLTWYARQTDLTHFHRFKIYSLGKQKLHKLHVQDLIDQGRADLISLESALEASINEEIFEELLNVDLGGNVANQDMRKMANEVGLRDDYNLIFSPSSAVLHGEWTGLKEFHLKRCRNPLHRFHRLPQLDGPDIIAPEVVIQAGEMLEKTFSAWLYAYHISITGEDIINLRQRLESIYSTL